MFWAHITKMIVTSTMFAETVYGSSLVKLKYYLKIVFPHRTHLRTALLHRNRFRKLTEDEFCLQSKLFSLASRWRLEIFTKSVNNNHILTYIASFTKESESLPLPTRIAYGLFGTPPFAFLFWLLR